MKRSKRVVPAAAYPIQMPQVADSVRNEFRFMLAGGQEPHEKLWRQWDEGGTYFRRRGTRGSPLAFAVTYLTGAMKPMRTPAGEVLSFSEYHVALCEEAKCWMKPDGRRIGMIAPRGIGKALALDTPVLTANRGWVDHGSLVVGDRVFDEAGAQCSVVAVSPRWENRPCYRLTFSDGEQIVADVEHEWLVSDRYRTRSGIQSTREIASKWLLTEARGYREVRYTTKVCGPLQYPSAALPIPPYVLGAWLGDGTSCSSQITAGRQDVDTLVDQLRAEGENPHPLKNQSGAFYISMSKPRPHLCPREHLLPVRADGTRKPCPVCMAAHQWKKNHGGPDLGPCTNRTLVSRLRDAGLLNNKHIPAEYFTASYDQRLALMQGLMDTDGHVAVRSGNCDFSVTNERLAYDFLRLARSLGLKAKIRERRVKIAGIDKGPAWRVTFNSEIPICRFPRKLERLGPIRAGKTRRIVNVEPAGNQTTSCVQVDSSSHLYLVGETLIPTHNSFWTFFALPLWAIAHGHRNFFAGYSHSDKQAVQRLDAIRHELEYNELLQFDFPELALPTGRGSRVNSHLVNVACGRSFASNGIDAVTYGLRPGKFRPDVKVVDDGEPDAGNYPKAGSKGSKDVRLTTIRDIVLPMNKDAVVVLSGTVVMHDSIGHDLVRAALGEPTADWIAQEKFQAMYAPPILDEGTPWERSIWPEWRSLESLKEERRDNPDIYALHMANRPTVGNGQYWKRDDFRYDRHFPLDHFVMYIDPAVVAKEGRDKTAITAAGADIGRHRASVMFAQQGHMDIHRLAQVIVSYKAAHPEIQILDVYIETNQGGQLWLDHLQPLMPNGVRLHSVRTGSETAATGERGKLARIVGGYAYYQARNKVWHEHKFPELEAILTMYPNTRNDDVPDSLAGALRAIFEPESHRCSDQCALRRVA